MNKNNLSRLEKIDFAVISPVAYSDSKDKEHVALEMVKMNKLKEEMFFLSYVIKKIDTDLINDKNKLKKILTIINKTSENISSKIENFDSIFDTKRLHSYSHKISLNNSNPVMIVNECSPKHIQSVLEHSVLILNKGSKMVKEGLSINPKAGEIGAGKLANMKLLASSFDNHIMEDDFEMKFKDRLNTEMNDKVIKNRNKFRR